MLCGALPPAPPHLVLPIDAVL
eukprot:COSAG01_NODE_56200_length_320_cov_0.502262_1_plen_21_part_01